MANPGDGKITSIQVLRAVAAAVVLISHLQKEVRNTVGETWLDSPNIEIWGQAGVDLFFVISGFIMVYVTRGTPSGWRQSVDFMTKRVFRVVPLYWILTFATLAVSFVDPTVKNHNPTSAWYVVGSFLFIPVARDDGHFTPVLGVGWTLNYEMMFYLSFALAMLLPRLMRIWAVVGWFLALTLAGLLVTTGTPQLYFWTRPVILEFIFGAVLAWLYMRGYRIPQVAAYILIPLGICAIVAGGVLENPTSYLIRPLIWGMPAALIMAAIVLPRSPILERIPRRIYQPLVRAGDGSYSLYLVHMFVIRAVTLGLSFFSIDPVVYTVLCYVLVFPISFIVADILYKHVEMRISRGSRRFLIAKRRMSSA